MIRARNGRLEVIVYVDRDPLTKRARRISRTVQGTGRAAMKQARELEVQLTKRAERERADGRDRSHTVRDLIDGWLEVAGLESSTEHQDRLTLTRHVLPVLGEVQVARLTTADLDRLYARLVKGDRKHKPLSPATVRRLHNRLSAALVQAEKWRWIPRGESPARWATPPTLQQSDPEAPSTAAVLALLASLADEPELRTFVWVVAATGLRRAAACALIRDDLDLDAGTLRTRRSLGMAKGQPYLKGTKTGARHAMALGPGTVELLRAHLAAQDATAAEHRATVPGSAFVFSHHDDGAVPWRPDFPSHRLRAIIRERELERVTLRGLRHWMITEGLDSGASVKAVAGRASHSRASTTLDVYAAFVPASDRDLAVALDGLLGTG